MSLLKRRRIAENIMRAGKIISRLNEESWLFLQDCTGFPKTSSLGEFKLVYAGRSMTHDIINNKQANIMRGGEHAETYRHVLRMFEGYSKDST